MLKSPENLKPEVLEAFQTPPKKRHEGHQVIVDSFLKETNPGFRQRLEGLEAFAKQEPKVPSTLVMRELPKPREAFVQIGGDFLRKGVSVSPGVPAVLPPLETSGTPNRLDLARWLVDRRNPLTARVTVNRVWQHYFGKGLVATDNDFGSQGSPPTHPELLDWLASEFMERGWSQKNTASVDRHIRHLSPGLPPSGGSSGSRIRRIIGWDASSAFDWKLRSSEMRL